MHNTKYFILLLTLILGAPLFSQTLNPPRELNYSIEGLNDVNLFWSPPSSSDSAYLSWDNGINADTYGFLLDGIHKWYAVNRFDTTNLKYFNGWKITKLRFFMAYKIYRLKISIWQGEGSSLTEIYSQLIEKSQYDENQWSEVALDVPFVIDPTKELRIGLYLYQGGPGAPLGIDEGPAVDGYGNWLYTNNQWYKTGAGNWNIQALAVKPETTASLHWDTGHDDLNAFGFDMNGADYSVAAQWDPQHLDLYDGWKIKSMKFYIQNTAPSTVQLKIWEGPDFNEVYSQDVTDFNVDDWTEITLDTPVEIDASKKLRAGIFVSVPNPGKIIGCDNSQLVSGYGFWLKYNGSWYTGEQAGSGNNVNMQLNLENNAGKGNIEKGLLGYNVYRDNSLLNSEPVLAPVYVDENLFNGYYQYYVTAVYDEGESAPSNVVTVHVNQPVILEQDSLALVDLYNQCDGDQWFKQDNWFELPLNEWFGITTEGNRVVRVWLPVNNITGDLPESIGNLTALKTLYIPANNITSIPESIGNCDSLRSFWISYNPLNNIPDSICYLSNLEELNITNTGTVSLPDSIGKLANLTYLGLADNFLSELPESFGNMESLEYCFIPNNQLEMLPESFKNLSKLIVLNLEDNFLSSLPDGFGNYPDMKLLYIFNNQLTDLPDSFCNMNKLKVLYLDNNFISALPDNFGNLAELSQFYIANNALESLPESFGNLAELDTTVLAMNMLTTIPESFGNLSDLDYLNLYQNQLTFLPESFSNLSSLITLSLSANELTYLPEQIGDLDSLVTADFNFNQIHNIPESIGNLQNIYLLNFSNNQLEEVPETIGNLSTLKLLGLAVNNINSLPNSIGDLNLSYLFVNDNNIQELPSTMFDNNYDYLYVFNNRLQFGSIEPLMNSCNVTFRYVPQAKISNDTIIEIEEGSDFEYTLEVTGEHNIYQWFKDGQILAGQNTNTLELSNIDASMQGVYKLEVSNQIVDTLVLESGNITLSVITRLNDNNDISFNVFPNPASTNGYFTITIPDYEFAESIDIYNSLGKKVKHINNIVKSNFIDTGKMENGLYILKVNSKNGKQYSKTLIIN